MEKVIYVFIQALNVVFPIFKDKLQDNSGWKKSWKITQSKISNSKKCQDGIQAEWPRAFTHVGLRPSKDGNHTASLDIILSEKIFPSYPVTPIFVPVYNHYSVFSCHKFQQRAGFPFSVTSWYVLGFLLGPPEPLFSRVDKSILLSHSSQVKCSSPEHPSYLPI